MCGCSPDRWEGHDSGQAWGGGNDPGSASAGAHGDQDLPADRARSQDGPPLHRAGTGAADLWATTTEADAAEYVHRLSSRAGAGLSRTDRLKASPGAQGVGLQGRLYSRHRLPARRAAEVDRRFEVRFETAPGEQGQVDFAQFNVVFTDEPTTPRIVWLFSMVLGYSRLVWARFVMHQDLATVLRCHVGAFEAFGGAPREILYDRMKTAVTGEGERDGIVYNRALIDLARHYSFYPKAFQPYRARKRKANWNDRSATSAKTSSLPAASATCRSQ